MVFQCLKDCADCYGVIGFEKTLLEKHKDLIPKEIKQWEIEGLIFFETLPCIFLDRNNKCKIYYDRPEICKIYGIDSNLPCPHLKPNGHKRSEASKKQVERIIARMERKVLKVE